MKNAPAKNAAIAISFVRGFSVATTNFSTEDFRFRLMGLA
jgi:hypothetical protein